MSLFYGVDEEKPIQKKCVRYDFVYGSLSNKSYKEPLDVKSGHPFSYVFGSYLKTDSKVTLLSHTLDEDEWVRALTLKYVIVFIKNDGTKTEVDLKETNF